MLKGISVVCFIYMTFGFVCADSSITKNEMIGFVDSIQCLFESRYAPREWKEGYCGWNCEEQAEQVKASIRQSDSCSLKEFHRSLNRFFQSTRDYHVNIVYYSTEHAALPFCVKGIEDRYYLTFIDQDLLGDGYDIEVGDELVNFDGKDPHSVVMDLKSTGTPNAAESTDRSLAEHLLTFRAGWSGQIVPRGPVTLSFKSHRSGEVKTFQMVWDYFPEKIPDKLVKKQPALKMPKIFDPEQMRFDRAFPWAAKIQELNLSATRDPNEFGQRVSFLPKLGEVIWETPDSHPFHAYLYVDQDQKVIGYLRIPHYMFNDEEVKQFKQVVQVFEEHAEALVIDQLNNTGGNLFVAYAFASMLADKPLVTPKEHIMLSQQEIMEAFVVLDALDGIHTSKQAQEVLGETFYGNPVNYQMILFIKEYYRFLQDQWKEGKFYTDLIHIFGVDHINPHPNVRFTKPILILINELDFSCGDFFPAIMQDNGRATLLGKRTAGAGGYVLGHRFANRLGVDLFTVTGSLAIRPNQQPIENLGVEPDVANELTVDDIRNHYQNYVDKIHDTLNGIR